MYGTSDRTEKTWFHSKRGLLLALVCVAMTATPLVAVIQPVAVAADEIPADAMVGALYDGDDSTSPVELAQLRADVLASLDTDGTGIDVAVIDTGVAAVDGLTGSDKVLYGPDFTTEAGTDDVNTDTNGHGTHMAGIIAGDREGAEGIAPGARIVSVKVAGRDGDVSTPQLTAAIDWVIANRDADGVNIRVLNLAVGNADMGGYIGDPLSAAVQRAWDAGIFVVVAAGNDGETRSYLDSPASNPYVMAVGASDSTAGLAGELQPVLAWSARGDGTRNPDVVAPGRSIASYRVAGSDADETSPEGRYGDDLFLGSGTSQSAAVVSGVAAHLLQAHPSLTPDQLKATLVAAATTDLDLDPTLIGNGVIDTSAALAAPAFDAPAQTHTPPVAVGANPLDTNMSGATWYGAVWYSAAWNGAAWNGAAWNGAAWNGAAWNGAAWNGAAWNGAAWNGAAWNGAAWNGAAWNGAAWNGAAWN